MFKPEEREYRNFASFDIQKDEDAKEIVTGYASTFEEYTLRDLGDEIWTERISPNAFDEADMSDVVFLRDHAGQVFARTKNGTITITADAKGLLTRTDLSRTSGARQMYEDIAAENYTQMSFGFIVSKQHFEQEQRDDKLVIHRVIDGIRKVFDISAVAFPANPTTEISTVTRAAFNGAIEGWQAERLEARKAENQRSREALMLKLKLEEQK